MNGLMIDIIAIISLLITLGAQVFINTMYKKYAKVANKRGMSGAEAARCVLDKNGLKEIYVVETTGTLTDHYDPSRKVIRLSHDIYTGETISSVSVACHECGHAIQDKENYFMMRLRSALVPFAISSSLGYFAIIIGAVLGFMKLVWIGILLECVILLFHLVTLPVEFNASARALKQIDELHLLDDSELVGSKKVLTAAALTYVASVLTTILQVLRLVLMFTRRDD